MRDGGGREETAASSGDDRSVRERRSVVRRRRTTGENNDVGGEGKHAAQVHLTALLPQPPEVQAGHTMKPQNYFRPLPK